MRAIILAGGLGMRLRPLTFAIPKPLIPVGDRPILEVLIRNLQQHGVEDVYLAVGYRAELIRLYFQDGKKFGVRIHYSEEGHRLGTAGPLRLIRDSFALAEPVLVTNADIITELDFQTFYGWHLRQNAAVTVGVRQHHYLVPYGVLGIVGEQVFSIEERPTLSFQISSGLYVLNTDVLDLVPSDEKFDMPDLIQAALRSGRPVCAYPIQERWVAIESVADLTEERSRMEGEGKASEIGNSPESRKARE
jgi:mannose-1-phosphate guanylyltransferase